MHWFPGRQPRHHLAQVSVACFSAFRTFPSASVLICCPSPLPSLNNTLKNHRCPECGCVYTMNFQGDANAGHHH
jgi:hypothetical protein